MPARYRITLKEQERKDLEASLATERRGPKKISMSVRCCCARQALSAQHGLLLRPQTHWESHLERLGTSSNGFSRKGSQLSWGGRLGKSRHARSCLTGHVKRDSLSWRIQPLQRGASAGRSGCLLTRRLN